MAAVLLQREFSAIIGCDRNCNESGKRMTHARIATDPAVMMGKPCINGTRITVELILRKLGRSAFIARVRNDSRLRERFAQNPRAVLREHGIDSAPYNLPDRVSEAQMERLLADLAQPTRPPPSPPPDGGRPPPVPVYGPP